MDFELWYLILVPLLFAAGWFARSFDIKEKQTIANEKDTLYKGVDLLLSNKQDQAIDAFINLVKLDPDTVEMHFSLAGLFRRRGEFDRAIKIHNVLVNREDLPKKIRSRALYELGEDYLKAGLWDRAEECFLKLSDTSESYKTIARKELLHIYETEKEWQKAIDEANIIQRQSGEDQSTRIAQLYCELTQQNLYFKNFKGAAEALEKALKVDPNNKRALIIKGKMLKAKGDIDVALATWKQVGQISPVYGTLVVEQIASLLLEAGRKEEAVKYLEDLFKDGSTTDEVDTAGILLGKVGNSKEAITLIQEHLKTQPTLVAFYRLIDLRLANEPENESLKQLHGLLKNMLSKAVRYKCTKCGFATRKFLWRCPGCHQWETFPPVRQENLSGK